MRLGGGDDQAARRGRLDRVDDQVAIDAAEREEVAFDEERLGAELRAQGDAGGLGQPLHRLDDFANGAVDVDREALERDRLGDVLQVLEDALDDQHLALDHAAEGVAVFGVFPHLQDQLAAVADVLDRVGEVVDEAGGDAAEHHLALLLADVLLQLDQPIGHRVEGVAELADFVVAAEWRRGYRACRRRSSG